MLYDKEVTAEKLRYWQTFFEDFTLPSWDELPDYELYMDQVISCLDKYLDFFPHEEGERIVTSVAINNYVRMRIMPAPVKKKYSRIHLAYLIMICTLKQTLSIAYISKIIPFGLSEEEMKPIYDDYVSSHKQAEMYFIEQIGQNASPVFDDKDLSKNAVRNLLTQLTACAAFCRNVSEKIIDIAEENK